MPTYPVGTKERNLSKATTVADADEIRIVQSGLSRSIRVDDFVSSTSTTSTAASTKNNKYRAEASSTNIVPADAVLSVDSTSGDKTVLLPSAADVWDSATNIGQAFVIKKYAADANNVIINTTNSQTIDGAATYVLAGVNRPSVEVQSTGSEWLVIG